MTIDDTKLEAVRKKLKRPRTVDELAEAVDVSRRTIFRWLAVLQERGHDVQRVNLGRPTEYQIR